MTLLVEHNADARDLLVAIAAASFACEVVVTASSSGGSETGRSRALGAAITRVALARGSRGSGNEDRGTKSVLVVGTALGVAIAWTIAKSSATARVGANSWGALCAGALIACTGIGLRLWAIRTLGRHFQRVVTIEDDQQLVGSGPYRFLRHPAYTGNLLTFFGIGVMFGSWIGAVAATAVIFAAHVPRILVEEAALERAFADRWREHARSRRRLVPGLF